MKNQKVLGLIVGFVLFVTGVVLLGSHAGIGLLLLILGIAGMIVGSVSLMVRSGKIRTNYFDNGHTFATDQASAKINLPPEAERIQDQIEQKQD